MIFLNFKVRDFVVGLFFAIWLLVGYVIIDDYGISMDEPIQRKHGIVSLEYVNGLTGNLFDLKQEYNININQYDHRDYGVIFQMFAYWIESSLALKDPRDIFILRHIMVFILFWLSTVYFYKLLNFQFKDWKLALVGVACLILSPRIFANSFYNPKDIPLLCWCIFSTYTLIKLLEQKNVKYALLHGLMCAFAINARIVGVYFVFVTLIFAIHELIISKGSVWNEVRLIGVYILSCFVFVVLIWPFLWGNPFSNLVYSFQMMSHFRWFGEVLYFGEKVRAHELPWHYIPVWIVITTPLFYLFLIFLGILFVFQFTLKNRFNFRSSFDRNLIIFFSLFIVPLMAVIILGSTLYNGWRHLYFIYPQAILLAVFAIWKLRSQSKYLLVFLLVYLIHIAIRIYMIHPFQNIYFNELNANKSGKKFDVDYYGLSFRQGLEKLLSTSDKDSILVAYSGFSGMNNTYILPYESRIRIIEKPLDSANFYITNYQHSYSYSRKEEYELLSNKIIIDSIFMNDMKILGIYELLK